jgi:hypothetical protein
MALGGMEAVLLGAAIGGGSSALRGDRFSDVLKNAALGGVTGGVGNAAISGIGSLLNPAAAGAAGAGAAGAGAAGAAEAASALAPGFVSSPSGLGVLASEASALGGQAPGLMDKTAAWWGGLSTPQKFLYGGAGGLGLMSLMNQQGDVPGQAKYDGPLSFFKYDPRYYESQSPMRRAQGGPVADIYVGSPSSAQPMASGGIASLGSYSDGGRLLKGPGDGMSDNIPATISNKRPARLADGEFVVPADVVSHLGNGSTDAGAKQLYKMMDKVRSARTGRRTQGRQIRPQKFMPA